MPRIARIVLLAGCALAAGCSGTAGPEAPAGNPAGAAASEAVGVVTEPVSTEPIGLEIEAVGTAVANESVEITSKISNTVTAIHFEEGEQVRRGSVLVELDGAEARAELAVAEAALAESRSRWNRSQNLYATQALSQAELEQIEATLKADEARVAAARARLSDTVIRAPFDGRTGFRRVSVGSLVSPGTVITTLDDTSVIKLDFTVPQTYFYALERGLEVAATPAGLPGRSFSGRISMLGSRVDPVTRSITVRAELANEDGILRPGMFMTVRLRADESPGLVVPEGAIVPEQGKTYVFVVENGVAQQREVSTGRRRPGEVEITAGLVEDERVIVEGTQKVRDQTRVQEIARAASNTDPTT